jgi:hypothetical protein
MAIVSSLRSIFERFQNLNLVFLIEDLRRGLTARGGWLEHANLCPVAHGMPDGDTIEHLEYLNHAKNLDAACAFAARMLGARPGEVELFVERWDDAQLGPWLLEELQRIWDERVEDASFVQELLHVDASVDVNLNVVQAARRRGISFAEPELGSPNP